MPKEMPSVIGLLVDAHLNIRRARQVWNIQEREQPLPAPLFAQAELDLAALITHVAGHDLAARLLEGVEETAGE